MVKWHSAQYLKRTHKFFINLPMMVKKMVATNEKNETTLRQDDIQEEMENMKIAFQTISEDKKPPNEFQYVNCHMKYDIKIEDF